MSTLYENIGKNLRAVRKSKKLTQKDLANVLGKGATTVVQYESGERSISLESILKLCSFYGFSVNDIIPEENAPIGEELVEEMKFLDQLKAFHFNTEEQKLILDFANLIIRGRSVNIG